MRSKELLSEKQLVFKEVFLGALIYVVVLGFLNEYTDIVRSESFSVLFLAAIVLAMLTYMTLLLKERILAWYKAGHVITHKAIHVVSVWLVLFFSKFFFVWVIDLLFAGDIVLKGFIGVTGLVVAVTVAHKMADKAFFALADQH